MPELGGLDRRRAASLFGIAPFACDSGRIRGGRSQPRRLLYMAAVSAIRCEPRSRACYERPHARGKPPKVALVAVMRRLAARLRENCLWQPSSDPPPGSGIALESHFRGISSPHLDIVEPP